MDHSDAPIRVRACYAAVEAEARQLIPELIDCLSDRERSVREAAHRSLGALTGQRLPRRASAWRQWWAGESGAPIPAPSPDDES